jgi:carboxymethylenebutenolidase
MSDQTLETTAAETEFARGSERLRGHLVRPKAQTGAGLVLIPDVHGLSDLYRELAARFAARGLATLAVDLYTREGAPKLQSPAEAMTWIAGLPDPRILGDLQAAVDHLLSPAVGARRVGVTGFCMGGQYALLAASSLRSLSACVSFYGMVRYAERNEKKPRSPLDAAGDLTCPALAIFGAEDALIPQADVEELRARLTAAGKRFEIIVYPGCGHAFLNHTRPDAYRPEAAADAFERAAGFFAAELGQA